MTPLDRLYERVQEQRDKARAKGDAETIRTRRAFDDGAAWALGTALGLITFAQVEADLEALDKKRQ